MLELQNETEYLNDFGNLVDFVATDEYDCSVNPVFFNTTIPLVVYGVVGDLTEDEGFLLEEVVVDAYNDLVFDRCDPFFREALDAECVVVDPAGSVMDSEGNVQDAYRVECTVEFALHAFADGNDPDPALEYSPFASSSSSTTTAEAASFEHLLTMRKERRSGAPNNNGGGEQRRALLGATKQGNQLGVGQERRDRRRIRALQDEDREEETDTCACHAQDTDTPVFVEPTYLEFIQLVQAELSEIAVEDPEELTSIQGISMTAPLQCRCEESMGEVYNSRTTQMIQDLLSWR